MATQTTNGNKGVALGRDDIERYSKAFNAERANKVAANAAVSAGVLKAATDYRGARDLPRDFSVELKQGAITNQERSGRCWMFAALNTLRYEVMHRWNLEDFEFSENYLFFWDKVEKSNAYLENVLATLDEPTDSRLFQAINEYPADDGGWWQMFVGLVDKYGLMPKSAYPESANSRDSLYFTEYLTMKLHEFAIDLRNRHEAGATLEELRDIKVDDMETVYRICAVALGEPPATFDFLARVKGDDDEDNKKKDDKDSAEATAAEAKRKAEAKAGIDTSRQIREYGITPMEFYRKYVPVDVDDFVTICNAPMKRTPFNRHYEIKYSSNIAELPGMRYVNVPSDVFHKAAIDQLTAGHPIWFACDCDKFALRGPGVFDEATVRVDQLFGTTFDMSKAQGLEYGDCPSNHAMTLTGVNIAPNGQADRWKIENSWGKANGVDGYFVASDQWFSRFITELIIRKEFLSPETLAVIEQEPVMLEPWEPLTARCE
ncbi:C1 family peptidase [Bifidobacterium sp. ESL0790]|uniref:C1 family peptidase n=1 Tax=Bifidobacterium sp. ESL0790 TaxID=2983233 RepID=UPI0023F632F1|nr:C1 family peptidase [Bifidobacterium sp. ESL0790]WEV72563.1 C1 family peptidase [Bifidobacterium sp. ESL0790]